MTTILGLSMIGFALCVLSHFDGRWDSLTFEQFMKLRIAAMTLFLGLSILTILCMPRLR